MLTRAKFIHVNSGKHKTWEFNIHYTNNDGWGRGGRNGHFWGTNQLPQKPTPRAGQGDSCSSNAYSSTQGVQRGNVLQAVADGTPHRPDLSKWMPPKALRCTRRPRKAERLAPSLPPQLSAPRAASTALGQHPPRAAFPIFQKAPAPDPRLREVEAAPAGRLAAHLCRGLALLRSCLTANA